MQHPNGICLNCPNRRKISNRMVVCALTGRDIIDHGEKLDCPEKKFSLADPGLGVSVLHGMIGIAKAVIGLDQADKKTVAHRRTLCRACPNFKEHSFLPPSCGICGCNFWAKTKLGREQCPDHPPRWRSVTLPVLDSSK
jgi:hypothetical protein